MKRGSTIKILIENNYEEMCTKTASLIAEEIIKNPKIVLSLPTGSTPVECYDRLVQFHKEQGLDFSEVCCFGMDEYISLAQDNPQSYYYFLNRHLYRHVNIDKRNTFSPNVLAGNRQQACDEYTDMIKERGGIDLILLGIGRDGHIAFNMPSDEIQAYTHVELLSEETISDNARFFEKLEDVPTQAMTLGINNIISSKKVILIASGQEKAEVIGEF